MTDWLMRKARTPLATLNAPWPRLPETGFIRTRPATIDDLARGDAIFCQDARMGSPRTVTTIAIPQYAMWRKAGGETLLVIVVQAEQPIGGTGTEMLLGLRGPHGEKIVACGRDVDLLGDCSPKSHE